MTEIEFAKRIIFKEYPGVMLVLVLNELVGAALVLVGVGTIIPFLGGLLGGNKVPPGPIGELLGELGILYWPNTQVLIFLVVLVLARIIIDVIRSYLAGWIGVRLNRTLKIAMNEALARTNWVSFIGIDQGKYIQNMVTESAIARAAVSDLASAFSYGLITSLLLGWLAIYSFEIFIVLTTFGGIFLWSNLCLMRALRNSSQERIELMAQMNSTLNDERHFFKVLLAENLIKTMAGAVNSLIKRIAEVESRQLLQAITASNYTAFFGLIVVAGISVTHLNLIGRDGSAMLFDLILIQRIASYFSTFQIKRSAMLQKIPSYEACMDVILQARVHDDNECCSKGKDKITTLKEKIYIEKATFSYDMVKSTLKQVTLTLPVKGMAFFVGPTGSGKTTLMDVCIGIITPKTGGRIIIDGKDRTKLDAGSWSNLVAYVPQDAYILSGSLREYLTFGLENVTEEKIWQSLRSAHIDHVVNTLPRGLDFLVKAGGINFSGGERHRLSIARALIREVKVLFLDEPSSALDKATEQIIFKTLRSLAKEILVITVTHSCEVMQDRDYIYQFNHGEMVWSGKYSQFLKQ